MLVDEVEYFRSGPVSARHANRAYSTADGSLALASVTPWQGRDAWGDFTEHAIVYVATDSTGWRFQANIRAHDDGASSSVRLIQRRELLVRAIE